MRRFIALLMVFSLLAGCISEVGAQTPMPATPIAGTPGSITSYMDPSIRPQDDLNGFANGGWIAATEIPADEAGAGAAYEIDDQVNQQLLGILNGIAPPTDQSNLTDSQKALVAFNQGVDQETRNAQGTAPIQPVIDKIDAVTSLEELHQLWIDPAAIVVPEFFNLDLTADPVDSTMNILWMAGPNYGLPAVEYYSDNDPANDGIREAYKTMLAGFFKTIGYSEADAQTAAENVYNFETELTSHMVTDVEAQDFSVLYNPSTTADLAALYPKLDWDAFLTARGVQGSPTIIDSELRLMQNLDQIITDTDLETVKDYLKVWTVIASAKYLSDEVQDVRFAYRQAVLGVQEQSPTEEEVLDDLNSTMGDALGQLYVDQYFPPESKAAINGLVENLVDAFRIRLIGNSWLSTETKSKAIEKLDAMDLKLGYPDTWKSYENVTIGDSYYQSIENALVVQYLDRMALAGQPVDRDTWYMNAQEVNAYYDPSTNSIVFPAAILQAPYFDPAADAAWNYGAIGATIGHEITHAFDLSGSQYDAEGNYADWWTDADRAAFQELNDKVAAQYSKVEVLPDLFIDGQLTVTENVADMGGLQAAYDAWQMTLQGTPTAVAIDGFTPEQLFFIAYAQSWRGKYRDETIELIVQSDPHSPDSVRANQVPRNLDSFYAAFEVQDGDGMYLPPDERVVIW